ncbi:MAG: hypothetical protein R2932_11985 [Caldilineaceae bacterium]
MGEVACASTATATPTAIVPTATPTPTLSSPPTAMPLEVVQYMLVDAETDQDIGPLTDGTVLDLAAVADSWFKYSRRH